MSASEITKRTYARVGLLGNPSDNCFGKAIAVSIENFYSEVTLKPCSFIRFIPHLYHDADEYQSLPHMCDMTNKLGFYGGVRLLKSLCKVFWEYCRLHQIQIPYKNFSLSYVTNIPRMMGLSGSSAIITSALNCLLEYYELEHQIPPIKRPGLILQAELDLGIQGGLMDRVIQVFGGAVYMDFSRHYLEGYGCGRYKYLDTDLIPKLFLIYADSPSDSGRVHSDVKRRWVAGDKEIHTGMTNCAQLAQQGLSALEQGKLDIFAQLMKINVAIRRKMYGDSVLGDTNLKLIETATGVGAAAKFTGSGGAVIAYCPKGWAQEVKLLEACDAEGFHIVQIKVADPLFNEIPDVSGENSDSSASENVPTPRQ